MQRSHNRGFGGGNMLGANCAKGDYICFINSDVKLIEDCVIPLCDFLEKHPKVGCITPQQLTMQYQKKASFDHGPSIKKEILGKNFLETIDPNKYPKRKNCVYKNPISVVHVFGALMVFPTNLFQSVGGFDANLFLYYEEYDICTRLKLRGYKSVFLPRYSYLHIHGGTSDSCMKYKERSCYELYKSKLYIYKKYHNPLLFYIYTFINVMKLTVKPNGWRIIRRLYQLIVVDNKL